MKNMGYVYRFATRVDMLGANRNIIKKLTKVALFSVIGSCVVGILLNYCLRMLGSHGGMYTVYIICGFVLTILYMYFHELTHALGIVLIKGRAPVIKFEKLVASCGAPFLTFSKSQYFFVAALPLILYCALLVPLCVLLPPVYFPIPFMPLCYNIFGSMGDIYMIMRMMKAPPHSIIVDSGTEVSAFMSAVDQRQ